ncbi:MAG: hypothetical protein WBG05_11480 [Thermoanaerobaculia bacterium]
MRNFREKSRLVAGVMKMPARWVGLALLVWGLGCTQGPKRIVGPTFYPALPEAPRLQYLTTINNEQDIGAKTSAFKDFVVGQTRAPLSLGRPWDVAHEKGKLFVVDRGLGGVVILDLVNKRFDFFEEGPEGALEEPFGIFVSADGLKYVADKGRGQVVVFDQQNRFHRTYGTEGQYAPLDVVVRGDRLYVCDVRDNEVEILDVASGEVVGKIGKTPKGREEGSLYWPTHLAVDDAGALYVTDLLNFRVQIFDSNDVFLRSVGELGDFPGAMPRPKGTAVDRQGHLFVVDSSFEMVQIFEASTGEVLMPFGKFAPAPGGGSQGLAPGASWLPTGIHIDYDNLEYFRQYVDASFRPEYLVYVTNQAGGSRLNVYAFGERIGAPER